MKVIKKIIALLLSIIMVSAVFCAPALAYDNNYPHVTFKKVITVRTRNTKNTDVFSDAKQKKKIGTIFPTDNVVVLALDGKVAKVSYPVAGKSNKTGWVSASNLLYWDFASWGCFKFTAKKQMTTYTRCDGKQKFGYISKKDVCYFIELSNNGKYRYVLYPVSGGYKIGWIKFNELDGYDMTNVSMSWLWK